MSTYEPERIEAKWQALWKSGRAIQERRADTYYIAEMFPYPFGRVPIQRVRDGAIADVFARYNAMHGFEVLHPIGWDAFGQPAENAAIKDGIRPEVMTRQNIERTREQLSALGFSYDWSREIATCEPEYYRWTQWLFLKCLEHDLVYRGNFTVHWCPRCETVISDEQVNADGMCWNCDTEVETRKQTEWAFRLTRYTDELLAGLGELDQWPESVRAMQHNWIGRQDGVELDFEIVGSHEQVRVFTTRPETLCDATFLLVPPSYPYIRETEGPDTGAHAVHPLTGEQIPIWIGDFVSEATAGVPQHDPEHKKFAAAHDLPTRANAAPDDGFEYRACTRYHVRDWSISRQRYWGTPIPIVYCDEHGAVGVPVHELPILLPKNAPITGAGAPLAQVSDFVNTTCPTCGKPAQRETETMDTFVDSAWYFLRYCDPVNENVPFDREKVDRWCPMDTYIGGARQAFLHLLYARFFVRACRDMGLLGFDEPAVRLVTPGAVTPEVDLDEALEMFGADAVRMFLLSAGPMDNDVEWNEDAVEGCFRFLERVYRFVSQYANEIAEADEPRIDELAGSALELWRVTHRTIERVGHYIETDHFHNAAAVLHKLVNALRHTDEAVFVTDTGRSVLRFAAHSLIKMLHVFAPHVACELWEMVGETHTLFTAQWPDYDAAGLESETVTIAIQVDGRLRATIEVPANCAEEGVRDLAMSEPSVSRHVQGREIERVIYRPGRVLNLVTQ